jgi:uncharacterized membrane protein (DUF485 family)
MKETERSAERVSHPLEGETAGPDHHPEIDWVAAERSEEFQQLVKRRRSFVLPATAFFLTWYFGFIVLAGYAPDFMGESVYEGLTVGYVLALSQFVMVWVLGWLYLRKADREFDPLAERAAEVALEAGRRKAAGAGAVSPERGPQAASPEEEEEVTKR